MRRGGGGGVHANAKASHIYLSLTDMSLGASLEDTTDQRYHRCIFVTELNTPRIHSIGTHPLITHRFQKGVYRAASCVAYLSIGKVILPTCA